MIVTSMSANDDKPDPPAESTPAERHEVRIGVADFEYFIQRAVRGMAAIVGELGDDGAGRRPFGPGSNSAYGLLTHCLGVIDYWGGALIAGRSIDRDRAAEFHAIGPVEPLIERSERSLAQLTLDIVTLESGRPLRVDPTRRRSVRIGPSIRPGRSCTSSRRWPSTTVRCKVCGTPCSQPKGRVPPAGPSSPGASVLQSRRCQLRSTTTPSSSSPGPSCASPACTTPTGA